MKPIELFEQHLAEQVRRHRANTKSLNLPSSVWGDLRPMLERIKRDFRQEAELYTGNETEKEVIIHDALLKIEFYYTCGFRNPRSQRLLFSYPDRR